MNREIIQSYSITKSADSTPENESFPHFSGKWQSIFKQVLALYTRMLCTMNPEIIKSYSVNEPIDSSPDSK